jgi:hypothetical protein
VECFLRMVRLKAGQSSLNSARSSNEHFVVAPENRCSPPMAILLTPFITTTHCRIGFIDGERNLPRFSGAISPLVLERCRRFAKEPCPVKKTTEAGSLRPSRLPKNVSWLFAI